jgi:hypothetical protein
MFTLTIETGNAAFEENLDAEIARILVKLADRSINEGYSLPCDWGFVRDINGNTVGHWKLDLGGESES